MRLLLTIALCAFGCGDSDDPDAGEFDAGEDTGIDAPSDAEADGGSDTRVEADVGDDATLDAPVLDTSTPDTSAPCVGEGEPCLDPIVAPWTDCRYPGECINAGERSQTTTVHICRDEVCTREFVVETDPSDCMRDTTSFECMEGGANFRCCEQTCFDLRETDEHCGACGIQCEAPTFCNGALFIGEPVRGACVDCMGTSSVCPGPTFTCGEGIRFSVDVCNCIDSASCGDYGECLDGFCRPI